MKKNVKKNKSMLAKKWLVVENILVVATKMKLIVYLVFMKIVQNKMKNSTDKMEKNIAIFALLKMDKT